MTDRMVCYCMNVPESSILEAIRAGARSLKDIQAQTGACTRHQCRELNPSGDCCGADILLILEREIGPLTESRDGC